MASFKSIALIYSNDFLFHDPGPSHPDSPMRLQVILDKLESGPLKDSLVLVEPKPVDIGLLTSVHSRDYVMRFEEACLSGQTWLDHPDNCLSYDSFNVALLAAGAGPSGVDFLDAHPGYYAFCLTRPPGHHALPARADGFCFFNNVAITARYWQKKAGIGRIFILDFDAHHGSGIQEIFLEDPSVFYASIHGDPSYSFPGTGYPQERGKGKGRGYTLNIPLPQRAGDRLLLKALEEEIGPALEAFSPDCLLVAAGFDGHGRDDMSALAYSNQGFGQVGVIISSWANRFCQDRLICLLEGGYNLDVLGDSVEMFMGGLTVRG